MNEQDIHQICQSSMEEEEMKLEHPHPVSPWGPAINIEVKKAGTSSKCFICHPDQSWPEDISQITGMISHL
jgi:hypothetical protein